MSIVRANKWQDINGTTYGAVINAYHAVNNTSYTVGVTSGTDLTNMSITVTPKTNTSRFILMFSTIGSYGSGTGATTTFWFTRNDSSLNSITGGNYNGQSGWIAAAVDRTATASLHYIDNPTTASSVTYKVRLATDGTVYIGRRYNDTFIVCSQHLTVMELAA